MNKNIVTNIAVLDLIYSGIDKVKNIICKTLGPNGQNVLISKQYNNLIINDGYTIINNITSSDYYERIGINICKSIVRTINDSVGDGTTSSIVLFSELLKKGIEKIKDGISVKSLVSYLNESLKQLLLELNNFTKEITITNLEEVLITSTNDSEIITNVKEAYSIVQKDGIILLKETNHSDYIEHCNGYFVNLKKEHSNTKYNDYQVLLFNDYLDNINVFSKILNVEKKIIILVKDASNDVINFFKLYNEKNGLAKLYIINHSNIEVNGIFEDLSYLLNVKVCLKELIDEHYLSNRINIVLNNNKLIFNLSSDELIKDLKTEVEKNNSLVKTKLLKERISKLTTGNVSIYVSGKTLEEQQYRLLKYEDTIKTGYNALTEGVVIGGGYIYYQLTKNLDNIYINILKDALMSLVIQLLKNNNEDIEEVIKQLNDHNWYSPTTKKIVSINDYHIYDATKTIKEILKVVISNTTMLLNTHAIIINQEDIKISVDDLI